MKIRRTGLLALVGSAAFAAVLLHMPDRAWAEAAPPAAIDQAAQNCSTEFDDSASAEFQACSSAIRALSALHAKAPQDTAVLEALLAAERNRSTERAVDLARELLRLAPENALAHGFLAYATTDAAERLAHLERAVAAAPQDPFLHGQLAVALGESGQLERAVAEMKSQIAINPDGADSVLDLSWKLEERKANDLRLDLFTAVLAMDSNLYVRCSLAARMLGEKPAPSGPERDAFVAACRGYAWYELALRTYDSEERVKLLERAIAESPDHPEANGLLAEALLGRNPPEVKEALAAFDRQVATNSSVAARRLSALVAELRAVATPADEASALASLLRSEVPASIVCGPLKSIDAERHRSEPSLWSQIVGRCGTNF